MQVGVRAAVRDLQRLEVMRPLRHPGAVGVHHSDPAENVAAIKALLQVRTHRRRRAGPSAGLGHHVSALVLRHQVRLIVDETAEQRESVRARADHEKVQQRALCSLVAGALGGRTRHLDRRAWPNLQILATFADASTRS